MASSVAQPPATRERLNELVAELFGDQPTPPPQVPASPSTPQQRWLQVVAQVEEQLRAKLRVEVLPERMRKALELVGANAVTLQADGSASVQSGKQTYTLAPDCPCADAKHRAELCKHALAVELHRRALAVLEGPAAEPAPAPSPAPAAPSASPPAAVAVLPLAAPSAPSAPVSHAWDVHEAPASACFKFRVGTMELMYTLRGVDDAELQRRITARSRASGPGAAGTASPAGASAHQRTRRPADADPAGPAAGPGRRQRRGARHATPSAAQHQHGP